MLDLSRVTLLFVETRAHEITKRVIDDCLTKADFGDVLIYSDQPERIPVGGARYEKVPDFPNKEEAGRFYYSAAMAKVETDFALMLEWDAGIFDASKWRSEFFNYDYIGAPWVRPIGDPHDVGNGGFTLMSKRLGHFVCQNRQRYPVTTDWNFCRDQRRNFERHGFKWPNAALASYFAWELGPRNYDHFGYHGAFNWPEVLSRNEVILRANMMTKTEYLVTKMLDLVKVAPGIVDKLEPEARARFEKFKPPMPPRAGQRILGALSPQHRAAMQLMQLRRASQAPSNGQKA